MLYSHRLAFCTAGRLGIADSRPALLFTLHYFSLPPGSRIPFGDLRSPTSLVRGRLPSLYWLMLLSLNSWPLQVPFPRAACGMGRAGKPGPYEGPSRAPAPTTPPGSSTQAECQSSATESAKISAGVFQPRHFLGRLLIRSSTI